MWWKYFRIFLFYLGKRAKNQNILYVAIIFFISKLLFLLTFVFSAITTWNVVKLLIISQNFLIWFEIIELNTWFAGYLLQTILQKLQAVAIYIALHIYGKMSIFDPNISWINSAEFKRKTTDFHNLQECYIR